MKRFSNILVGVDLSDGDNYVCDELSSSTEEAISRALRLAKRNSAKLFFFYSLDVSAQTERLIEENQGTEPTLLDRAKTKLEQLVARAKHEGVAADCKVVFGKSWVEIICQVLRGQHDLVVVGSRHKGAAQRFLLGSTGIKLLRKCPCPVCVIQPQASPNFSSILVAHDLSPVGDLAMQLGSSIAQIHESQLHVVHAEEKSAAESGNSPEDAKKHIAAQLENFDLSQSAQIHLVSESPDVAILELCKQHGIELLVMGTVARTGIPGLVTGNTAERLLPQIPCSVLAVKPEGFKSPVTLDE